MTTQSPAARLQAALEEYWPEGCNARTFLGQQKPEDIETWLWGRPMWGRPMCSIAAVSACHWRRVAKEANLPFATGYAEASQAADTFQSIFEEASKS